MGKVIGCSTYDLKNNPIYKAIAAHLITYQSSGEGWGAYASKILPEIRNKMRRIFSECRRNGFVAPTGEYDSSGNAGIRFYQVVDVVRSKPRPDELRCDLCTMCERDCTRRDENGAMKDGVKRCWEYE